MTTVNVYLTFNGNCEEAFNFYKAAFEAEFAYIGRFNEMPAEAASGSGMSAADGNKIMHVSLPISSETILMGSDTGGEWSSQLVQGNNFSVSINTDSRTEADRLFKTLSQGGTITMPMNQTFWGAYFGMFTDRFGINWMVNYDAPQQ
jgi:PhnB protein